MLLWGYPEMDTFFERLAIDTRGDREGFPAEVMSELMLLSVVHSAAHWNTQVLRPPSMTFNRRDAYQLAHAA